MEFTRIEAFLVVAEDLHVGKASQRLYGPRPMVGRGVGSLPRRHHEIGGSLTSATTQRPALEGA